MKLFLDICLGIGLALAVGLRPFMPALLAGVLASANAGIDFSHTDFSFLESPVFLVILVVAVVLLVLAERRLGPERVDSGPLGGAVLAVALALGALLFAGALADDGYEWWPGLIGGVACAALAVITARLFLRRIRARLDSETAVALPAYAEAAALALAALSVFVPPVSLVFLAFLVWLLIGQRRREGEKYAGLRILR
ncbi:MAG: hypothetical protein JWQ48_3484 [Conexibacter sp.]|nr:hypothetical protein [Conexibacter sp.]